MEYTKKHNNESFIDRCLSLHGNRYDYCLIEYKNFKEKVKIICKEHGVFEQSPQTHLEGSGCPKCGGRKKLNTSEFIKRSNEVHSKKYDYSLVKYKNNREKVKIICKDHGIFDQIPFAHMNGTGCPKCRRISKIDFIKNGDIQKYDYSLIGDIVNNKEKVKIICKDHGVFKQSYNNHIGKKNSCPKCCGKIKYSKESFVERSLSVHGYKYDYSLVEYVNRSTKVKIICRDHGVFEQEPMSHINSKCGCRKCRISKGESKIINFLKSKNIKYEHLYIIDKKEFDFYLPDYNIFIEYDGIQHFEPVNFFGGELAYKKQIENDNKKNNYCYLNNISLIRIPYYDYDKIEILLNEKISNLI